MAVEHLIAFDGRWLCGAKSLRDYVPKNRQITCKNCVRRWEKITGWTVEPPIHHPHSV